MRKLRIKNIKSFKDSGEIEFKPITIFVGKNSCGKSSLIRFPVVLAQTFTSNTDSSLMFYGRMIDYGNYDDVVFKRSEEGIHFEVHYDIDINNTQDSRYMMFENQEALEKLKESMNKEDKDIRDVSIRATINNKNKRTYVEKVELFIENNCLVGFYKEDKVNRIELNYIREDNELIPEQYIMFAEKLTYDGFFPFYDMRDIFSDIVGIVLYGDASQADLEKGQEMYNKLYSMANPFGDEDLDENEKKIKIVKESMEYASTIMSHIYQLIHDESMKITYIGPFRENPERVYRDPERKSSNVGVRGENTSTVLIRDYQKKQNVLSKISTWLEQTMGYKLLIKDMGSSLYQIMLEDENGIQSNILDVGFGISQVLPIITQLIISSVSSRKYLPGSHIPEKQIIIEQPELHLHPAAQADLADLFVDCIKKLPENRIILETHSEHMIRKFQILVADKSNDFSADDICIYYIDKNSDGIASVEEMKILPNGKFERKWPSGFFDKAHELSMELLRNSAK